MQNSSVKNRLSVIMVTIVNNNSFTNGSELNYYNENESMCLVVLELISVLEKLVVVTAPLVSQRCVTAVHHPRVGIHFSWSRPSEYTWYSECITAVAHDCKNQHKEGQTRGECHGVCVISLARSLEFVFPVFITSCVME